MSPERALQTQPRIFPALPAWLTQFRSLVLGLAITQSRRRATPSEGLCQKTTSCLAPRGCFAFQRLGVHRLNFRRESGANRVASKFPHHGQKSAFRGQAVVEHSEIANLAVVRELSVHRIQR